MFVSVVEFCYEDLWFDWWPFINQADADLELKSLENLSLLLIRSLCFGERRYVTTQKRCLLESSRPFTTRYFYSMNAQSRRVCQSGPQGWGTKSEKKTHPPPLPPHGSRFFQFAQRNLED